jgi:hypothetical protein
LADFAIDYGVLHSAREDLHKLADEIKPTLSSSDYATLGEHSRGTARDVFGDAELAAAFGTLYERSRHPMQKAEDDLRRLGDTFGAVADAFFNMDSQIAEGAGVMGQNLGLSDWRSRHRAWLDHDKWAAQNALWQKYLANKGACDGDDPAALPDFCRATDPGPEPGDPGPPPVDQVINTPGGGRVHTVLTLDDKYNVVTEKTTVTTAGSNGHNGQTYTSTTTYKPDGRSYTTDTVFADHSTTHSDVTINPDGTGTMTVKDGDGKVSGYSRSGPGAKWVQTSGEGMDDNPDDGGGSQSYDYIGY